jgi:hypothetical protein
MIKKWIILFLVLTFLNFIIAPDYVFAGSSFVGPIDPISGGEATAVVIGSAVVLGLIIVGIVLLAKHSKSPTPTEQPKDPNTKISPVTNLDEQLITPTGELILARW